ncbi:hypothetical protein P7C71_g6433, partial [Lecanoromycetidae sp. Uapishka_2]
MSFAKFAVLSTLLALAASAPNPSATYPACPVGTATSTNTLNEIVDTGSPCKNLTVIFARGTCERGNLGDDIGPSYAQYLEQRLGEDEVAIQGVNYSPTWATAFAGGSDAGAATMASLVTEVLGKCPDTMLSLGGYR